MTSELNAAKAALLVELDKIDSALNAHNKTHRDAGIAEVRLLMTKHGLVMSDISASASASAKASKPAAAAKYGNARGQTWAGRGKRPTWLRDAISAGQSLDSFRIVV